MSLRTLPLDNLPNSGMEELGDCNDNIPHQLNIILSINYPFLKMQFSTEFFFFFLQYFAEMLCLSQFKKQMFNKMKTQWVFVFL